MNKITMLMAMCLLAGCASLPAAKSDKLAAQDRIVLEDGTELQLRNCKTLDKALQDECQTTNDLFTTRAENAKVLKENEALKNELAAAKKGKAKKPKKPRPPVAMAAMVMPDMVPNPTMMADKTPPRSPDDGDLWIFDLSYVAGSNAMVCLVRHGLPVWIAGGLPVIADLDGDSAADPVSYRCSTASGGIRIPAIEPGERVELVYLTKSRYKTFWTVAERRTYAGHRTPTNFNNQVGANGLTLSI